MSPRRGGSGPDSPIPKKFSSLQEIDRGLRKLRRRVKQLYALDPGQVSYGDAPVKSVESDVRSTILDVFGPESPEFRELGYVSIWKGSMGTGMPDHEIQARFAEGIPHVASRLEGLIARLEEERLDFAEPQPAPTTPIPGRIFIGHGNSKAWLQLNDFLTNRLKLDTEEFNRESPAGLSHKERLLQMLDTTSFAFLVMTAEDEHADGTRHARENVIHEIGLFQGKHGFERAIVLAEEGCVQFSNIHGLNQIRFPGGKILACWEQIRQVLEREGLL